MTSEPSQELSDAADRQFWSAVERGDADTVRTMLADNASLASKNYDPNGDDEDFYPLAPASSHGHLEIVELLLAHGADINKPDQHGGYCAIQRAVENRHFDVAHLLLDHRAAVDAYPDSNQPLMERLHNGAVADGVPDSLIRHGYRRLLASDTADGDLPKDFDPSGAPDSVRLLARVLSMGGHCTIAPLIRHGHADIIEEIFRLRLKEGDDIWGLAAWYGYADVVDRRLQNSPDLVTAEH